MKKKIPQKRSTPPVFFFFLWLPAEERKTRRKKYAQFVLDFALCAQPARSDKYSPLRRHLSLPSCESCWMHVDEGGLHWLVRVLRCQIWGRLLFGKLQSGSPSPYNSSLPSNHCLCLHVTLPLSHSSSDTEQPIKKPGSVRGGFHAKDPGESVSLKKNHMRDFYDFILSTLRWWQQEITDIWLEESPSLLSLHDIKEGNKKWNLLYVCSPLVDPWRAPRPHVGNHKPRMSTTGTFAQDGAIW